MGVGVPFAIGAKLARPEVPVVSINGDCAFGFNAMELETAVRCKLPIVFIVNNGIVGSNLEARMGLPQGYTEPVVTYVPDIRYDKILEAFWRSYGKRHPAPRPPAGPERAYQATRAAQVACVNVISDHHETMATRSRRAGALMGYDRN